MQGRLHLGDALSGRDITAVNKTLDGLLKLLYPDPEAEILDEDIEWAVELALECRRRVKEQQKKIGSAEFRNTQFSYRLGEDGVEKFVVTPELQSPDTIGLDPLPPGQIWGMSAGDGNESPGLYRIDVTDNPGSGVRIINRPAPAPLQESVRIAEQNLLAHARALVGDKSPREHEFSIQARALDAAKSGATLSIPVLLALCSSLLQKSIKGGLIAVGNMTLGGGIETVVNAVSLAELAMEKGADTLLMPVASRKQLFEVSDDVATKVSFLFYSDAADALIKSLGD